MRYGKIDYGPLLKVDMLDKGTPLVTSKIIATWQ